MANVSMIKGQFTLETIDPHEASNSLIFFSKKGLQNKLNFPKGMSIIVTTSSNGFLMKLQTHPYSANK